jgi:hypothetical protein
MAMFTNRIMVALFAIALASSLILASGLIGSAFAAKKNKGNDNPPTNTIINSDGTDKSSSPQSQSVNGGGSGGGDDSSASTGNSNGISAKDLKSLSKCEAGAAQDGDLMQTEVADCYSQVFG